jgi:hypothetical protein
LLLNTLIQENIVEINKRLIIINKDKDMNSSDKPAKVPLAILLKSTNNLLKEQNINGLIHKAKILKRNIYQGLLKTFSGVISYLVQYSPIIL